MNKKTDGKRGFFTTCIHAYATNLNRIRHARPSFLSFCEQALKLVKQIMAVDSSKLPREVVRTVVAVSGHKEDNFRRVCGHIHVDALIPRGTPSGRNSCYLPYWFCTILYDSNRRPTVFRANRVPEPYDALLPIATRPYVGWQ